MPVDLYSITDGIAKTNSTLVHNLCNDNDLDENLSYEINRVYRLMIYGILGVKTRRILGGVSGQYHKNSPPNRSEKLSII